jgi:hypothetical protein
MPSEKSSSVLAMPCRGTQALAPTLRCLLLAKVEIGLELISTLLPSMVFIQYKFIVFQVPESVIK